jgi:hypothetical protein
MRSQQQQQNITQRQRVPYHGAEEVNIAVRQFISETPDGTLIPMSASLMILKLVEQGMIPEMAAKLPSQIRKGAPLYAEWKAAYASKKFEQKLGRTPNNSHTSSSSSSVFPPSSTNQQQESQPRRHATRRGPNDDNHQFWSNDPFRVNVMISYYPPPSVIPYPAYYY